MMCVLAYLMEEDMNIYILYHCFEMLNCVSKNRLIIPSCLCFEARLGKVLNNYHYFVNGDSF